MTSGNPDLIQGSIQPTARLRGFDRGLEQGLGIHEHGPKLSGRVICELTNILTGHKRYSRHRNLITTAHKQDYANYLTGVAFPKPTHIAVGTGSIAFYDDSNVDTDVELKSTGADQQLAQTVASADLPSARSIKSIKLWLKRIGSSTGTLTVEIHPDSAGQPSGTAITNGTSQSVSFNSLTTSYTWIEFTFTTSPSLTASTKYHLVLKSSGYTYSSAVTEVNWGVDQSAPGYTGGEFHTYNGTTWTTRAPAADAAFRLIADPLASFTVLEDELDRNALTSALLQGSTKARLLANFTPSEANDHLGEVGLLTAAAGGTLIAVSYISLEKTSVEALNIYWIITVS